MCPVGGWGTSVGPCAGDGDRSARGILFGHGWWLVPPRAGLVALWGTCHRRRWPQCLGLFLWCRTRLWDTLPSGLQEEAPVTLCLAFPMGSAAILKASASRGPCKAPRRGDHRGTPQEGLSQAPGGSGWAWGDSCSPVTNPGLILGTWG